MEYTEWGASVRTAGELLVEMERLPFGKVDEILGGRLTHARPMILAPHPDDESLGCGGLIAMLCAAGRPPLVVILTDGVGSHPGSKTHPPERLRQVRAEEAQAATAQLGLDAKHLILMNQPDTALDPSEALAMQLGKLARDRGCATILGPWIHDPHGDHGAAARLGRLVAGQMPGCRLLHYPVWGWLLPRTTRLPMAEVTGWRLDITGQLAAKQEAIAAHVSQYGELITDSTEAFKLPRNLLAIFERPYEVYLSDEQFA